MRVFPLHFLGIFFSFLFAINISFANTPDNTVQQGLKNFLTNQPTASLNMVTTGNDPAVEDQHLLQLYEHYQMQPLWFKHGQLDAKANALIATLQNAVIDGLNPDDYKVAEILNLEQQGDEASQTRLDVLLTLALVRYIADMSEGSADPCLLAPDLFASARDKEIDLQQVVNAALQANDIAGFLNNQAPAHSAYQGLRSALARYRQLEQNGGWEHIPSGKTIRPGDSDPRIPLIARRLALTGEFADTAYTSQRYDQELTEAITKFQSHHLLEQDGVIGKKTLEALNIPATKLVRQIIINMERWRWLPHRFVGKHLIVNIAEFQLFGTSDEHVDINMPVIVGKVYHKTPVFTGSMRYLEVNPYWNIPDSITVNEIVPHMQENPDYLQENNIRIFDGWQEDAPEVDPADIDWHTVGNKVKGYRLRQEPGPENALGRIKFIFPNKHNVYLHDTPAHHLFLKTKRDFSHGCIRVSRPLELGAYLLAENKKQLSVEQLEELVATKERKVILLDRNVPVHVLYLTVKASTENDEVYFYPDIYGRDALLEKALFARIPLSQCRYPQ